MPFGLWDYVLIVGVAAQAAVLAYMYDPRWKALTLAFPIPFTIACLAVGQPVGPTNVFGLVLLMGFIHGVRILHYNVRLPIVPAIALGAGAYCAVGWWLAGRLPTGDVLFWPAALAVTALGATAVRLAPRRREHGHRTGLPLHLKLPMIVAVVVALVMMKSRLQGFMTVFPMVTVIAAYEARKCLWIICRQIAVVALTVSPMVMVIRLVEGRFGLGLGLLAGWAALLLVLLPFTIVTWKHHAPPTEAPGDPVPRAAGEPAGPVRKGAPQ